VRSTLGQRNFVVNDRSEWLVFAARRTNVAQTLWYLLPAYVACPVVALEDCTRDHHADFNARLLGSTNGGAGAH
jgi:hypothetical protein